MNEQQVVSSLLAFYKQQGMDLAYVLDDPVFIKLPLSAKVDAIRTHAKEIAEGTSPGFNKIDRGAILSHAARSIISGALTGGSLGAALGAGVEGFDPKNTALIGAVAGAAAGIGGSTIARLQEVTARNAIRNHLLHTAENPTDANAIGALSIRGIHQRQNAGVDSILQGIQSAADKATSAESLSAPIGYYIHKLQNPD